MPRKKRTKEEEEDDASKKRKRNAIPARTLKKRKKTEESEEEESEEEDYEEEEEDYEVPEYSPKIKIEPSKESFTFKVENGSDPTVEVVIGNYSNAYEGACDAGNLAESWLSNIPPKEHNGGTVMSSDVSMKIPAMAGEWMVGHLNYQGGCCGAVFWHTKYVGPDARAAANLVKEFEDAGMGVIENVEGENVKAKGLRLIGRYSWDYYRTYEIEGLSEDANELFEGPHCFFVPASIYKDFVFPDIFSRAENFDDASKQERNKFRFKSFLSKIGEDQGALALMKHQEYIFAKVFLQPGEAGSNKEWIGVRAILVFTYDIGDDWEGVSIEDALIDTK